MAQKHQLTTADHMSYGEYAKLLCGLRRDKEYLWETYARLSFYTACRGGDVLRLRWIDILGKAQTTIVEEKTDKARVLQFNEKVQAKIWEMYRLLGEPNKAHYIFHGKRSNNPMSIQYVNRILKQFKYLYGIQVGNFSTHSFRKTFGRYVYEKSGKSAESLMLLNKIFNHTSIQVTKTYIGITRDEIKRVFDCIDI